MYVRLDCLIRINAKILRLKSSTCWYFVCSLAYANHYETGGLVPKAVLPSLWSSLREPRFQYSVHTTALIEVGLFVDEGTAYRIHDYHDYQPSSQQMRDRRAGARARQERYRGQPHACPTPESKRRPGEDGPAVPTERTKGPSDNEDLVNLGAKIGEELSIFGSTKRVKPQAEWGHLGHSHGVTQATETQQPELELETTELRSGSNLGVQGEKGLQSGAPPNFPGRGLIQDWAKASGWGDIPEALNRQFTDLRPAPTIQELEGARLLVSARQRSEAPRLRSPACYALKALQNARRGGTVLSHASGGCGGFRDNTRPKQGLEAAAALYEILGKTLTDTHWHLGWTLNKAASLVARGICSETAFRQLADILDQIEEAGGPPASWAVLLDRAARGGEDGK